MSDTINVTLPNGATIRGIPRGTPPDEIKRVAIAQGIAAEEDFGPAPAAAPAASEREPMGPPDALLRQGAGAGMMNDDMSTGERILVGMGRGVDTLVRGVQSLAPGIEPPARDPQSEAAYADLSQRFPVATGFGEIVGEAAPFATTAYGVQTALQRAGARLVTRLGAQGVIGGAEGGAIAAGREQNVPLGVATGAGLAVAMDLVGPYLYRAGRSVVRRVLGREPRQPILDAAGELSEEVLRAADEAGLSPDDLIDEVLDLAQRSPRAPQVVSGQAVGDAAAVASGDDIARALNATRSSPEAAARLADPDPQIMAAAERLGLDDLVPASAVSRNRAFQEAEQGLKSSGATELGVAEDRFLARFRQEADKTIGMMGGTMDRGVLNADVADDFVAARGRLQALEGAAFDRIRDEIPTTAQAPMGNTEAMIRGLIADYGGREPAEGLLTTAEKKALRMMEAMDDEGVPTYAALDRLRRDIGQALFKKSGPFKDDATERLDQLYGALRQDQKAVAEYYGLGDVFEEANALTVKRKGLEDRMTALFGRNLDQALLTKLDAGVSALERGDMMKLKKVMDALPAGRRQEAAASLLNRMFTSGARSESTLSQGFVGFYDQLNRSPKTKEFFFGYLPEEARQRMDDIHAVAKGFYGALQYENKSRTANAMLRRFEEGGWLRKLLGLSQAIPGGRSVFGDVAQMASSASSRTKAADALLQSPRFREALKAAATKNAKAADDAVRGTKAFRDWIELQPPHVATSVAGTGLIPYLMQEEDQAEPQQP